jgi:hypothetical protein
MRRITVVASLAIEAQTDISLSEIRRWVQEHLEMQMLTVPMPMTEKVHCEWESAPVIRAFVERITEQGGET